MISLFKGLRSAETLEHQQTLSRAVSLLIEAIGVHAPEVDEREHLQFQKTLTTLALQFEREQGNPSGILPIVDAVVEAMSRRNRAIVAEMAQRKSETEKEFRSLVATLTDALAYACKGHDRVTDGLRGLEKQIEGAAEGDDLRRIKTTLETCVSSLRTEIDRQDVENREMRDVIERAQHSAAMTTTREAPDSFDAVTRLPDRRAARRTLLSLFQASAPQACGVCLRLDRLPGINSVCGYEAGNEYLALVSRLIRKSVPLHDNLYRWSGPGYLIIADNKAAADQYQRAIERLNNSRESHVLSAGSRSMAVGIAISSARCELRQWADVDAFMAHVDGFVSSSGKPEPVSSTKTTARRHHASAAPIAERQVPAKLPELSPARG